MARIELRVGAVEITIEGDEDWVATQFQTCSAKIVEIAEIAPMPAESSIANEHAVREEEPNPPPPLATHLKDREANKRQTRKFLATADWLRRRGESPLTTKKVTAALRDNQQKRLTNASQCLNDNVKRGFCEKDGSGFYITQEGLKELGY